MVLSALEAALRGVDPALLVKRSVTFDKELEVQDIRGTTSRLRGFKNIYVVGAGKAAASMANALCAVLGEKIADGAISVPYGDSAKLKKRNRSIISVTEASHPVPDNSGLEGSNKILNVLRKARKDDVVFVLISGGGSALMPLPPAAISLSDKQKITNRLLRSGASIHEMNVIRKHLSSVKGGQLLRHVESSCRVISLIISDVIDDDFSSIASGPTFPDSSTFSDALNIARKYDVGKESDPAIQYLATGADGILRETPKPGDAVFDRVNNVLIGNNSIACNGAASFLRSHGIKTLYLGSQFDGEAKQFGAFLARLATDLDKNLSLPFAIVLGGETTVNLRQAKVGTGGRNLESALSYAIEIKSLPLAIAFLGTDGIDGNSDAAGAIVSKKTVTLAMKRKQELRKRLSSHDSYHTLRKLNSVIFTGRTGTNVNDIVVLCRTST